LSGLERLISEILNKGAGCERNEEISEIKEAPDPICLSWKPLKPILVNPFSAMFGIQSGRQANSSSHSTAVARRICASGGDSGRENSNHALGQNNENHSQNIL
jgi:hypothetical protein